MKKYMTLVILSFSVSPLSFAGTEGMPSMPKLEPKSVFKVENGQDLESQRGFGDKEPEVRMMNLMMVEGSGMEGMDMMTMAKTEESSAVKNSHQEDLNYEFTLKSPIQAKVGANKAIFTVIDKKTKRPATELKLKAQVYMTSMDMGTEEPAVKETAPGTYELKAPFSMKGPWALKIIFPDGKEKIFNFEVVR